MINKSLDQITIDDINALITNLAQEGKDIEYKESLTLDSDKEKGELLADISSFANTVGGQIFFGIKESDGKPTEVVGINIKNPDELKLKIESITRDGIVPRIGIEIKILNISDNSYVVIIQAKRSWNSPHRVIYNGYSKTKDQFYARNSAGKYQMDVLELKNAFNSFDLELRVSDFINTRIAQINANSTPIPLMPGGKLVLHLIPISNFATKEKINLTPLVNQPQNLSPLYSSGWSHRINLEGLLLYAGSPDGISNSYTQIYRNGSVEAVEAGILRDERSQSRDDGKKFIPSLTYEKELIQGLDRHLKALSELGVTPPILISLAIVGAQGFEMAVDTHRFSFLEKYYPIDRDVLWLPTYILEGFDEDPVQILKPMFDLVWNTCGYKRSYNFNDEGEWAARE